MRVTLVAAVSRNGVIGAGGAMPWRIADDLRRFRSLTLGKPVIMGRKTFESIGRALAGRRNIVVTRNARWNAPGAEPAPGFEAALELCAPAAEAMVIGGSEIYRIALARAGRIHLTRVEAEIAGDAVFPKLDPGDWRKTAAGALAKSPQNDFSCRLFTLDRLDWRQAAA